MSHLSAALDNGALEYAGDRDGFMSSGILKDLALEDPDAKKKKDADALAEEALIEEGAAAKALLANGSTSSESETSSVTVKPDSFIDGKSTDGKPDADAVERKAPRKLIEDEKRATGRISKDVWWMYIAANGGWKYWTLFVVVFGIAMVSPLLENGWLRIWSASYAHPKTHEALYYIGIYSLITLVGVIVQTLQHAVLYSGSLKASHRIHKSASRLARLLNSSFLA